MSDKTKAKTYEIKLSYADRMNLLQNLVPARGEDRGMARLIRAFRKRLEWDHEVPIQQVYDGTYAPAAHKDDGAETFELTAGEVELLKIGQDTLEERGRYPSAKHFLSLDDRVDALVKKARSDG